MIISRYALAAALLSCAAAVPVQAHAAEAKAGDASATPSKDGAQDKADSSGNSTAKGQATGDQLPDDLHDRRVDYQGNILVSAPGVKQLDLLAGTSVFEAEQIQENLAPQIGDVLADIPGVSATSFAPGASRPVLRGFQGVRVRVLTDGLGTLDVSNTSVDHATTIDPLTAERIEVLRGPAVLLFGSQAIGGAVNVIDKRIPRRVPKEAAHLDLLASVDSASDLTSTGASIDVPLSPRFVVHVDGSYRDTNDVSVPGFIASDSLRSELFGRADALDLMGDPAQAAELRAQANRRGTLPDSATRAWTADAGFAFIDGENTLGASVGWYQTQYGTPSRPGGAEGGGVSIDLKQFRTDLRGELALGDGFFEQLKTRVGYSDYTHSELEGSNVGTTFDVQGVEARLELAQRDNGWWRGSLGMQYFFRDFLVSGEEANISPNTTSQFSAFALQEFGDGPVQLQASGRVEITNVDSKPLGLLRDFTAFSGAAGVSYETEDSLKFGVNLSRVERAPSAEELYANGPHVATQAFEIGNPDLKIEHAWGLEGYVRGDLGPAQINFAVYKNWFGNYIYQAQTGAIEDGLPVLQIMQTNANYFGFEGQLSAPLAEIGPFTIKGDLKGDYIRASLADGSPIPQIPPLRLGGGIAAKSDPVDLRGEVEWYAKVDRLAAFETPTKSFALVNLSLAWRPFPDNKKISVVIGADNLFDAQGRRHASFTKDFVPLPGRNFKASLRVSL